jgi:hypothetical protein
MAFFGTFACSAPAQRNERQNRPGYSVFLTTFLTFHTLTTLTFSHSQTFFCRVLHVFEIPRDFTIPRQTNKNYGNSVFCHFSPVSVFSGFLLCRAHAVRISSLFRKKTILTIDFQLFSASRRPKNHPFFVIFTKKRDFALYAGVHAAGMRSK